MNIPKLEKDGKVAVVYSPGFGAGWSTWNAEFAELLTFHRDIVQCVLDGQIERAASVAENLIRVYSKGDEDLYSYLSSDGLKVEWIEKGSQFEIQVYDGSEKIHIIGTRQYLTA